MKPITFDDWSGGLTDKNVPGETNRAATLDNVLIDSDKRPLQRDGFDVYSSTAYQIVASERVGRLVNFDLDSEVLAFQNKRAYAISAGAWTEVTGPGGGSSTTRAFNTNTAAALFEEAQWQHHLYMASNSGDPPIKMYRDSGGTMRLRTAGLPEWTEALTPTDGGLALSIALANDIRTKMISHFTANGATAGAPNSSATGHHMDDAGGLLDAQLTDVTATTAATNLATLITLMNDLRGLYSRHISDAQAEDISPTPESSGYTWVEGYSIRRQYHLRPGDNFSAYDAHMARTATAESVNQPLYTWRHYLNFTIADPAFTLPSNIAIADLVVYVNDLRDKWNWHTYAPLTHFNAAYLQGSSNFGNLGLHATSLARVEPYTWASIAPNMGPLTQFVIDLKKEYDAHRLNDMHMEDDTVWTVPSGVSTTPTNFQDAMTLLGWLAYAITYHAMEADTTFCKNGSLGSEQRTASTTSGAATLSLDGVGGFTADKYKFMRVVPIIGALTTPFAWLLYEATDQTLLYNVTASNTATPCVITTANNFTSTKSAYQFMLTSRHYHMGDAASQLFDPAELCADWDALDSRLLSAASLQQFADLAQRIAGYLKSHTEARTTASTKLFKKNNKSYTIRDNSLATFSATGNNVLVHAGMDNTNFTAIGGVGGMYLSLNSALLSANTAATQLAEDRFDIGNVPTASSVNYKAVFKYDYTVGTKSFTDRSAPSESINAIGFVNEDSTGSTEIGRFAANLTNIYAFANAANENYDHTDTTNFRKEIYRTIANGTRFYKVNVDGVGGDITNATTTLNDVSSDTYLVNQLELYTNNGAPENNKPPLATSVHVFGNLAYYVLGNKVYQSIPNDPDSVPSDFFEEFEEDIRTVSSTRSVAVAFGGSKVYRLTGGFDDLGRGALVGDTIFDRTGAISAQSVVKADNGIFFAGKDGFYYTDGYQCMRVTDLEKTFRTYTDTAAKRNAIQGTYDNISKRVYWTVNTTGGTHPDKIWVLDLQFGIKPEATPITTFSKTSGFNPTALTYFNGQIYYADGDGYVFVQTRGRNIDLVKDTAVAATLWSAETVQWDVKSCHYQYGTEALRKQFSHVTVEFDMQSTNVSAQIVSDADKGRSISNLPVIRSRKLTDWGDSKIDWVASVYPAKSGNLVDEWRRFNGDGYLRSNYRAIEIKTAYCVIVAGKDMGTVTIANVAGNVYTVTLTSLVATRKWPLYSVGYYIVIAGVSYPVTVRTSDSVIRIDSTGLTAPTTGVVAALSWEMWGYPKNERAKLLSYSVWTDLVDANQTASQGPVTTGGENS